MANTAVTGAWSESRICGAASRRSGGSHRGCSTTSSPRQRRWSMAVGPVGGARPKRASSSRNVAGSSAGRRLRSPPNNRRESDAHHSAARRSSRAAARGRFALACRLATASGSAPSRSSRVHRRRRRSGKRASVRRRVSAMRHGARTRSWFEPPSFDLIRSGFQSAMRPRRADPKLREVRAIAPPACVPRQSRSNQRGGASCRSATSHGSRRRSSMNSSSSVRPAGGWARPWNRFHVRARTTMPG